jgi:hypothetical protein
MLRHQIAVGILVVAHRDVAEAVDHAEIGQHAIGGDQILDQRRIGCTRRLRLREGSRAGQADPGRQQGE